MRQDKSARTHRVPRPARNIFSARVRQASNHARKWHWICADPLHSFGSVRRAEPSGVHARSEERRVGKECVSPCRARWSACHEKKKIDSQDLDLITVSLDTNNDTK